MPHGAACHHYDATSDKLKALPASLNPSEESGVVHLRVRLDSGGGAQKSVPAQSLCDDYINLYEEAAAITGLRNAVSARFRLG
jgi:hypothetical protein